MPRLSSIRQGETDSPAVSVPTRMPRFGLIGTRFATIAVGALLTLSCTSTPEKPISADSKIYKSGTLVQDCVDCPKMVVVAPGTFEMGSRRGETDEKPRHEVTLRHGFAVGLYEVTFQEWSTCVEEGGCRHTPNDENWGRQQRPLVNVSWHDAQSYITWLNKKTGMDYRLLSEAEWEYAARAQSDAIDLSGLDIGNCRYCYAENTRSSGMTVPVGQHPANDFRLHDMLGNVWEWVEDCYVPTYRGAPANGAARSEGSCQAHSIRGGSWKSFYGQTRAANRGRAEPDVRRNDIGFRVARTVLLKNGRETAQATPKAAIIK
ncbi:formylglycine-generating enzyme family protein [Pelagibius sp. Alg239-R121]|uniref:formylglycine-generating enzyme family protein n=1 Tax=Pelagibius sp. Alg239-R121 TaxID=2993448 RepID=UPI0024A6CA0B|nr:formylglycine-generating enzyme family protein [Pelagibius sp. Alg239-R121]